MLRARKPRREDSPAAGCPSRSSAGEDGADPEHEALLADSVGLALLVVLDTLTPAERLAFVLHDMFAVPFDEIAPIVERTPDAARQLASRARRRVRGAAPAPDADLTRQREVVDAFLAAARDGDFDALLAVLDPDVVLRVGRARRRRRGHRCGRGGRHGRAGAAVRASARPAMVNGAAGIVGRVPAARSPASRSPSSADGSPRSTSSASAASPDSPRKSVSPACTTRQIRARSRAVTR